jgi:hypothetical protein
MTLPFKQALKEPDSKTLEFSGEGKSRSTITLCSASGQHNLLQTFKPFDHRSAIQKRDYVNARDEYKEESSLMSKLVQRRPIIFN